MLTFLTAFSIKLSFLFVFPQENLAEMAVHLSWFMIMQLDFIADTRINFGNPQGVFPYPYLISAFEWDYDYNIIDGISGKLINQTRKIVVT